MIQLQKRDGPEGRTIAYRRAGQGRPVVLLHGITEHSGCFAPIQQRLSETYDVLAIDLAGHGESHSPEVVTLAEVIGDIGVLLAAETIEALLLIGHSYGAVAAAALAAQGVGRGLVLIDQVMELTAFRDLLISHRSRLEGPEFKETFKQIMSDLGLGLLAIEEQKELGELHDRADQALVLAQWASTLSDEPEIVEEQIKAILSSLAQPVLSLHGTEEDKAYRAWLTGLVPSAQVEFWPGTGHWLHIKEPERFCARIRAFDQNL